METSSDQHPSHNLPSLVPLLVSCCRHLVVEFPYQMKVNLGRHHLEAREFEGRHHHHVVEVGKFLLNSGIK